MVDRQRTIVTVLKQSHWPPTMRDAPLAQAAQSILSSPYVEISPKAIGHEHVPQQLEGQRGKIEENRVRARELRRRCRGHHVNMPLYSQL